jgi:porphobilinogen synthase
MQNNLIMQRPRRNRKSGAIRSLVQENLVTPNDLIAPLFVTEGEQTKDHITSLPGQYRLGLNHLLKEVETLSNLGIKCISLFPVIADSLKDTHARESLNPDGIYMRSIKQIKAQFPDMMVMTDVAMDPYSCDGHDGYVDAETGVILNDKTLDILSAMALAQAQAGADIIGPSDMMDGRVGHIRKVLDKQGYTDVSIMSYSVKYCSHFYSPFRDALDSAPKLGDKKTYQMDYANSRESLREMRLDQIEGADMILVKPGLPYLDIIAKLRPYCVLPLVAFNVSGEYAMIKAASEKGWLDEKQAMGEVLTAFKRAGCDMIITYFAKEMAQHLNQ